MLWLTELEFYTAETDTSHINIDIPALLHKISHLSNEMSKAEHNTQQSWNLS